METGTTVSVKAIQRRLFLDFDLKSCKPARKPRLAQAMKEKRHDFAKRHASWDTEMWKRYFFRRSLLHSSFLFKDIGFGGLLQHATRKSTLPRQ